MTPEIITAANEHRAKEIIAERVQRGIAWLDAYKPRWEDNLSLDELDMASCSRCVLGQLYYNYWRAPMGAQIAAVSRGFCMENKEEGVYFHLLTEEWKRQIIARLNKEKKE